MVCTEEKIAVNRNRLRKRPNVGVSRLQVRYYKNIQRIKETV